MKLNEAVPHASVAVGVAKDGTAGQKIVVGPGSAEIVGTELSVTVIDCEAVVALPH